MKLISLFMVCCTTCVNAQSWFPDEAIWHYAYGHMTTEGWILGYVRTEVSGDTTLSGQSCLKLAKTREAAWPGGQPFTQDIGTDFLYEEDGLVMAYDPTLSSFDTLYNMNAVPGDHWRLVALPESSCDTLSHMLVTDTGTTMVDDVPLRWLSVEIQYYAPWDTAQTWFALDTIVDRIGTLSTYLLPMDLCTSWLDGNEGGSFRCYSDSQLSYTANEEIPCDLVTTIGDLSFDQEITIRQDHHVVFFTIPFSGTIRLDIYDLIGSHISSASLKDGSSVDLSSYAAGVYLLRMDTGNAIRSARVVID